MSIPSKFYFFWGKSTVLPYIRYLTLAFTRLQHPSSELFLYQCKCNDADKWGGGVFQDFQFNGDELNKCYKTAGTSFSEEFKEKIRSILLPAGDPAPWDRIRYDSKAIIKAFMENIEPEKILVGLEELVKTRKEREAKRPTKHDYVQDAVERLGVKLKEYEPSDKRVYSMPAPNVSDIFSVEILIENGGWYLDCDQLIMKNLDNYGNAYDFLCGGQTAPYIGVFGSRQGGLVVQDFYTKMLNGYNPEYYNSTGISAIFKDCIQNDSWMRWFKTNGQINQITEQDTFYPLNAWDGAVRFWGGDFDVENCTSFTCHYFGGHATSQKYFREKTPENVLQGNDCMARYMRKLTQNGRSRIKELCLDGL